MHIDFSARYYLRVMKTLRGGVARDGPAAKDVKDGKSACFQLKERNSGLLSDIATNPRKPARVEKENFREGILVQAAGEARRISACSGGRIIVMGCQKWKIGNDTSIQLYARENVYLHRVR